MLNVSKGSDNLIMMGKEVSIQKHIQILSATMAEVQKPSSLT